MAAVASSSASETCVPDGMGPAIGFGSAIGGVGATMSLRIDCELPPIVPAGVTTDEVAVIVPSARVLTSTFGIWKVPPDGVTVNGLPGAALPLASFTSTVTLVASGCVAPLTVRGVAKLDAFTALRSKLVTPLRTVGGQPAVGPATGLRPIVSSLTPTVKTPSMFLFASASAASLGGSGKSAVHVVGSGSPGAAGGSYAIDPSVFVAPARTLFLPFENSPPPAGTVIRACTLASKVAGSKRPPPGAIAKPWTSTSFVTGSCSMDVPSTFCTIM